MVSLLLLNRTITLCILTLIIAILGGFVYAGTLDLPITVDTHLDSRTSNGADNWNFGSDHTDKVVVNSSDSPTSLCRALFQFPESLWTYAPTRILSATVVFYVWQDNSGSREVTLYPLTTNFVQGSGSKYAQPDPVDGATWWTRDGTNAWANPGGDFDVNYPVIGVKEDYLDPNYGDRFFHWDITEMLTNPAARAELEAYGALLQIEELPYPQSGVQYWAAFTSSHDPSYQAEYQPHLHLILAPDPVVMFNPAVTNGFVSFGISNLTADATNIIERSSDLLLSNGWLTVTSFTARGGITNWSEGVPPGRTNAYYRIKSLP